MNRQMQTQSVNPYFNLRSARFTVLFLIALTVFNIVSYLSAAENASYTYFWFNISFPFDMVALFEVLSVEMAIPEVLYFGIAIAAVSLLVYAVLWFFSSKNRYVLLAIAVLYTLDLVELLLMSDIAMFIIDIIIHIIVLIELYGTFVVEGRQVPIPAECTGAESTPAPAPAEEDPFAYAQEPTEQNETPSSEE